MRTFIALELPEQIKKQLHSISKKLQAYNIRNIKWVSPENYHITLTFIGDIGSSQQKEILELIEKNFSQLYRPRFTNPELKLVPTGSPRVLWIEYSCDVASISSMNRNFRNDLCGLGLKIDKKPLKFHVTLARVKTRLPVEFVQQAINIKIPPLPFVSETLTFYQSILKPEGPVYHPLSEFNLIK